jgi:hypothetical protein
LSVGGRVLAFPREKVGPVDDEPHNRFKGSRREGIVDGESDLDLVDAGVRIFNTPSL